MTRNDDSSYTKTRSYKRQNKPPLSYIALIAMAIKDSPSRRATLTEINEYLMRKFEFFRGPYSGWRNSIRHNLSLNECFVKVLRDPGRPWGKDNYWTTNPHSEYTFANGVFSRRRKRLVKNRTANNQKIPIPTGNDATRLHSISKIYNEMPFTIDNILKPATKNGTSFSTDCSEVHNTKADALQSAVPLSNLDFRAVVHKSRSSFVTSGEEAILTKSPCSIKPEEITGQSRLALPLVYYSHPFYTPSLCHWMTYANVFWHHYFSLLQNPANQMCLEKQES